MSNKLMKIESVSFGYGGYQDAMFGLSVNLSGGGTGVSDFHGTWGLGIKVDKHTKWTEADRDAQFAETMRYLNKLLDDAKVREVSQLEGIPVEVEFDGMALKSWRILTEVL